MMSQLACFGVQWNCSRLELQPLQEAAGLLRRKGPAQRAGGVGGEIVLHHPDQVCRGIVDVHEVAHAVRMALRGAHGPAPCAGR
jgi:hypothetical protein